MQSKCWPQQRDLWYNRFPFIVSTRQRLAMRCDIFCLSSQMRPRSNNNSVIEYNSPNNMGPKTTREDVIQQVLQSDGTLLCFSVHQKFTFHGLFQQVLPSAVICVFSYSSKVHISLCSSTGVITRYTSCISVAYFHYMLHSVHYRVNAVKHVLQQQYITQCRVNTHPFTQTARHTLRDVRAR